VENGGHEDLRQEKPNGEKETENQVAEVIHRVAPLLNWFHRLGPTVAGPRMQSSGTSSSTLAM
jgi:hypothetical protein